MKNRNDLISIIVPIYNVKKYINKTMDSIFKQTYKNIEIILVDDGSIDGSEIMCDRFQSIDNRVKVIHKKNGGLSDARNVGIKVSNGKYITFIDGDDIVENDYIEYLFGLIKKFDTNIAICPHKIVKGNKYFNEGRLFEEKRLSNKEALTRLLLNEGYSVSSCGKLYRLSLFNNISFPVNKLCEDNGTTYKLFEKCKFIAYGNEPKYNYIIHENSITTSKFNVKKLDLITLTDEMCNSVLSIYPELVDCCNKRRNESRFAILRQLLFSKEYKNSEITRRIINELKINKKQILKNKYSTIRDKIAIITLLFNKNVFKLSWIIYKKIK